MIHSSIFAPFQIPPILYEIINIIIPILSTAHPSMHTQPTPWQLGYQQNKNFILLTSGRYIAGTPHLENTSRKKKPKRSIQITT